MNLTLPGTVFCIGVSLLGAMAASTAQRAQIPRTSEARFRVRVAAGERYQRRFGPDFLFTLAPESADVEGRFPGWDIGVFRIGDPENLLQTTLPMRGPRPIYLFASYLLPNQNAPGRNRVLRFSPEVGHTITEASIEEAAGDETRLGKLLDRLDTIVSFGQVTLNVRDLSISGTTPETAAFEWVELDVEASWPRSYHPNDFKFIK